MLPIEDRPAEPRRRFPIIMLLILIANVAVFVYEVSLSPAALNAFVEGFGVIPARIIQAQSTGVPLAAYATLLTGMFLHGSLVHLVGNLLFFWVFADNVESFMGHRKFLVFYVVAGIVAFGAQIAIAPSSTVPAIGASGAVAGVLAAYLLLFPRAPVRVLLFLGPFVTVGRTAALPLIGFWFLLQAFQSLGALRGADPNEGGVAYVAHVGGFLFGVVFTLIVMRARGRAIGRFIPAVWGDRNLRNWILVVGALVIALAFVAGAGGPNAGPLQLLVVAAAVLFAVVEGLIRASGRRGVLGDGRGFGRLAAIAQVIIALGALLGMFLA
jgi:membrane associated rhomboid family serine protease